MAEQQQRNPNLMNPKEMQAVAGTRGAGENAVLFSEAAMWLKGPLGNTVASKSAVAKGKTIKNMET